MACLLYEDEETLIPLKKELGIIGLKSFRMNLNNHELHKEKGSKKTITALNHSGEFVEKLKKCAAAAIRAAAIHEHPNPTRKPRSRW